MIRIALVVSALAAFACGGTALSPGASAPGPSPAAASSSPAPSGASRVEGTVQSAASSKLTLSNGTILDLTPTTRIIRTDRATTADLRAGLFVAITAKRQPDETLLASVVSVFSESLSRAVPPGQRPLPEGNLMTNASIAAIDQVSGASFTVTFPGGSAKVNLAPDAVILKQVDVKPEDLPAGTKISATVVNGAAQSIQIQSQ